jgi:hypothetical protein
MSFNLNDVNGEGSNWVALKPGISSVTLTKVEFYVDKDKNITDNLSFNFKGVTPGNTGEFTFTVYSNTFDPADSKYKPDNATRSLAQLKHIIAAYVVPDKIPAVKGETWKQFATIIIKALTASPVKNEAVQVKVILNNTDKNNFPLFPNFIVSSLTPDRVLSINNKINPTTQQPYDKIVPTGVNQSATPGAGASPMPQFGATETPDMSFGPDLGAAEAAEDFGTGTFPPQDNEDVF